MLEFCHILNFRHLCASMRCSAGSEEIFLDKQSEICQIFSSLEEFPTRARRTQKSKNHTFSALY